MSGKTAPGNEGPLQRMRFQLSCQACMCPGRPPRYPPPLSVQRMGRDRSLVPEALASSSRGPCRSEHARWGRPTLDEVGALDTVSPWHSIPWVAVCPCQLASPD
eukprot:6114478-Pyramimonas_sp.AAC.1